MKYAIETTQLSKQYGNVHAVRQVSLGVKSGEIYAFLGLNGAGKTTTIRMLLGMIRPSGGNARVLNQAIGPRGSGPWAKVGYMVESPSAYPDLSVRENLEIARRMYGIADSAAVERIMEKLSIASYAGRKAGALSSGNLQRLGLARAMMHEPKLLILDEPTNALDPAGIVEIRDLLLRLAHEDGVTIFMSSHILSEVDKLADRIGIIHKGAMIEELDAAKLEEIRARQLIVSARDVTRAYEALAEYAPAHIQGNLIAIRDERAVNKPESIAQLLVHANVPPTHLAVEQEDLEEYFLRLTA